MRLKLLIISIVVLMSGGEVAARFLGLIDFPLYDANAEIGYIPSASQRGSFMNRNDWQINELHMSAGPFQPSSEGNVLLIGDSIVWGGNSYAANERLGAQWQSLARAKIWPVAAGSWGLQNEITYLNQHPDVVGKVDEIVFVSNSGDFDEPSSWVCEMTHPRKYPQLATLFLLEKFVLKKDCPTEVAPALRVPKQNPLEMLRSFGHAHPGKPLKFILYPDRAECESPALRQERLEKYKPLLIDAGATEVHSLGDWEGWTACASLYKDPIHPVGAAYGSLSRYLNDRIRLGKV